jgi:Protein of unknown function (DUF2939)
MNAMFRFLWRHAIGTLIVLAIAGWALFYVPGTPSYAVFQLKRAIDARDGAAAASFVDFPSVVRNAGYEMVQQNAAKGGGGMLGELVGKGAVDLLAQPAAAIVRNWAVRQVDNGAKDVQMPAGVVAGAILFLHRSGDTAWTDFRDDKGREWNIHMALRNGRWQIVEVKDIRQLVARIEHDEEQRLGSPGTLPGGTPPGPASPSGPAPGASPP